MTSESKPRTLALAVVAALMAALMAGAAYLDVADAIAVGASSGTAPGPAEVWNAVRQYVIDRDAQRQLPAGGFVLTALAAGARSAVNAVLGSVRMAAEGGGEDSVRSLVRLDLFTRDNSKPVRIYANDTAGVQASPFSPTRKTKFCIHGYLCNTLPGSGCSAIKDALLEVGDFNVILVDWSAFDSKLLYPLDVERQVPAVGQLLGDAISTLLEVGADADDMHVIGHSLGSHIAGFAGDQVLGPLNKGVITGLDPAGPMYGNVSESRRLSPTDARFVEAIHTDGGMLGITEPVAQLDVYYNGGKQPQPGCTLDLFGVCSHCFVFEVYIQAIRHPEALLAWQCSSHNAMLRGACEGNARTALGLNVDQRMKGTYFVQSDFRPSMQAYLYCIA